MQEQTKHWQEEVMHVRGLDIAYRRMQTSADNSNSHKIIALHGWLDNAASFAPVAPLIDNADIIAIDLPGHGLSSHRSLGSSYAFQDYIFDLFEVIKYCKKNFQWDEIVLMGHSMGSVVCSLLASGYSTNILNVEIKRLIYFDFFGTLNESADNASDRIHQSLLSYKKLAAMTNQSYSNIDDAVNARLKKSDMRAQEALIIMQRNVRKNSDSEKYHWRFDKRLLHTSATYFTPEQTETIMKNIRIDALVFAGAESRFRPMIEANINDFANAQRKVDYHVFTGSHYVHMEQAEKCAKCINQFLEKS